MKPPRFVVAGEALMDVFTAGATDDGVRLDARMGGSPFNVAVGLARLEQPVAFLGSLSTDLFGERLLRRLKQAGVDVSLVQRQDAPTTLSVVTLDRHGVPHYAFHGHGAADRLLDEPELPATAAVLHVGSYAMVVPPVSQVLLGLLQREHTRRLVSFDVNVRLNVEPDVDRWRAAVEAALPCVHLLKLSEEDVEALAPGRSLDSLAAEWLRRGVPLVVVTRGAKGARAWNAAGHAQVRAEPVMLVDTVGAGDAFQAGLLTWLAERDLLQPQRLASLSEASMTQALAFASSAAAVTCGRRGAEGARRAELPGVAGEDA